MKTNALIRLLVTPILIFPVMPAFGQGVNELEPTSVDHPSAESCMSFLLGQWIAKGLDKTVKEAWTSPRTGEFKCITQEVSNGGKTLESKMTVRSTRYAPIVELTRSSQTKAIGGVQTVHKVSLRETTFNFENVNAFQVKRLTYTQLKPDELSLKIEHEKNGKSSQEMLEFRRVQTNSIN